MKLIQIEISDLNEKILKHDLIDVQQWVQDALNGKINNIKIRLLKESQCALFNDHDVESIPASEEGCIELYFSRPYYKNRIERSLKEKDDFESILTKKY